MCPFKKAFPFAILIHLVFVAGIFSAGASEEASHKAVFNLVPAQGQGEGMTLSVVRVGGEDSETPAPSDSAETTRSVAIGDADSSATQPWVETYGYHQKETSLRDSVSVSSVAGGEKSEASVEAALGASAASPAEELTAVSAVTPTEVSAAVSATSAPAETLVAQVLPLEPASSSQRASLARAKFTQSEPPSSAPASGSVAGAKSSEEALGGAGAGNGSGKLTLPIVISRPKPMRPDGVSQGEVVVTFVIDSLGSVQSAEVVKSPSQEMASAVLKVLPRWRFSPAKSDGHAIPIKVRQVVEF